MERLLCIDAAIKQAKTVDRNGVTGIQVKGLRDDTTVVEVVWFWGSSWFDFDMTCIVF